MRRLGTHLIYTNTHTYHRCRTLWTGTWSYLLAIGPQTGGWHQETLAAIWLRNCLCRRFQTCDRWKMAAHVGWADLYIYETWFQCEFGNHPQSELTFFDVTIFLKSSRRISRSLPTVLRNSCSKRSSALLSKPDRDLRNEWIRITNRRQSRHTKTKKILKNWLTINEVYHSLHERPICYHSQHATTNHFCIIYESYTHSTVKPHRPSSPKATRSAKSHKFQYNRKAVEMVFNVALCTYNPIVV